MRQAPFQIRPLSLEDSIGFGLDASKKLVRIVDKEAVRENFVLFEWIDLHTGLEDVVAYLRGLLDKASGPQLSTPMPQR